MKRSLPLVLLTAVFLAVGCGAEDPDAGLKPVGSTAPDFTVQTLSIPSSDASLAKRRGKVVLLDYWATWCGPCRQLTPTVEALYDEFKGQGLEAMAITGEARDTVADFESLHAHKMPVYLDSKLQANERLGVTALPTVFVIDRQGHIAYRFSGVPGSAEGMREAIETSLKG